VVLVLLGVTLACSPAERACTLIAAEPGVGLTVATDLAPALSDLRLRVCQDDCVNVTVSLDPGSSTVPQGCAGDRPEDPCSATAVPDGTLVGFASLPDLRATTARISASGTVDGTPTRWPTIDVAVKLVYPNGPDCAPDGPQGRIRLSRSGLSAA
jgi:hypothetical protein